MIRYGRMQHLIKSDSVSNSKKDATKLLWNVVVVEKTISI